MKHHFEVEGPLRIAMGGDSATATATSVEQDPHNIKDADEVVVTMRFRGREASRALVMMINERERRRG